MKNNYYPKVFFYRSNLWLVTLLLWLIPYINETNAQLEFDSSITDPFGLVHDATPDQNTAVRLVDIDGDGVLEAFVFKAVGGGTPCCGEIDYYENDGTSALPNFVPADFSSFGIIDNSVIWPREFVDIDGDGDYDLIYLQFAASTPVRLLRNNGTATEPDFADNFEENPFGITLPESPTQPGDLLDGTTPVFEDLDQDGDLDLMYNGHFLGSAPEAFYFAENLTEPGDTIFAAPVKNDYGITYPGGNYHQSVFVDTDGDSDPDLFSTIVSGSSVTVWHFENTPDTSGRAQFTGGPDFWYPFGANTPGFNPTSGTFWDYCGDGDLDLICGGSDGIYFWENHAIDSICVATNEINMEVSLTPNPVLNQLSIVVDSELIMDNVQVKIFDAQGKLYLSQKCETYSQKLSETLDVNHLLPGIYILKIESDGIKAVQKFIKQ